MDKIFIKGLKVYGHHGVLAEEKQHGQTFLISLELFLDTRPGSQTDELAKTANYAFVIEHVLAVVKGPSVNLIETLAQRIANAILQNFPLVQEVMVEVQKPYPPVDAHFNTLGVVLTRTRHEVPASRGDYSQSRS